jgi:hypothetical protein
MSVNHDARHSVAAADDSDGVRYRVHQGRAAVFSSMEHLDGVARTARETLATLPDARVDEARVIAAAKVLQDTASRWASLAPGDELDLDWPEKSRRRHR